MIYHREIAYQTDAKPDIYINTHKNLNCGPFQGITLQSQTMKLKKLLQSAAKKMTNTNSIKGIEVTFGAADPHVEISAKLQAQYPHHLVLVKAGNFLHAFNKSAYALHILKQYKIRLAGPAKSPHLLVGFPLANYKQRLWPLFNEHSLAYVCITKSGIEVSNEASSTVLDTVSDDIVNQVIADLITQKQLNTSSTAKALANPNTQDFLFKTKAADLDMQLLEDIIKLPRDIRVTWGENVRQTMQRIMRNTFLYGNEDNKPQLLKQLSADIDLMRHYISQAKALNRFKFSFDHRVGLVVELGKILGGLQRAQRITP